MQVAQSFSIEALRVPVERAQTLEPAKVAALAEDMLENGQKTPIMVREDGDRFVLVEGLHRLEAAKALGETKIEGYLVQPRRF